MVIGIFLNAESIMVHNGKSCHVMAHLGIENENIRQIENFKTCAKLCLSVLPMLLAKLSGLAV